MCQTRSLPLMLKLQNKQIGVFRRNTRGAFQFAISSPCPLGGSQPRTTCPFVTVAWNPQMHALPATEPDNKGESPRWWPQKPGHQVHVEAPLREIPVLWSIAEGKLKGSICPLRSLERIKLALTCVFNQKPALRATAMKIS